MESHTEDPDEALSSWLQLCSTVVTAATWGLKSAHRRCFSLSFHPHPILPLSNKQMNK